MLTRFLESSQKLKLLKQTYFKLLRSNNNIETENKLERFQYKVKIQVDVLTLNQIKTTF